MLSIDSLDTHSETQEDAHQTEDKDVADSKSPCDSKWQHSTSDTADDLGLV